MTEKAPVSNSKLQLESIACSSLPGKRQAVLESHVPPVTLPIPFLASKYNHHYLGDFCWVSRVFPGLNT